MHKTVGTVKWRPKEWCTDYDRIVGYSALGDSNIVIAKKIGITKEHVSTILNLPEAKELYFKLQMRLRAKIEDDVPSILEAAARKSAARVKEIIDDDTLKQRAPFQMAALAMDVLKGAGHFKSGNVQSPFAIVNNGQIVVNNQQKSDLLEGLNKVQEVKRLHSGSIPEAEWKDGNG